MMKNKKDFIIIGAGPAGLVAGYKLAQNGFSVLILEREETVKRKVCGEYLSPFGVETFIKSGLKSVLEGFLPLKGMDIYTPVHTKVQTLFPKRKKREQFGLSVDRQLMEKRLIELAIQSGVQVEQGQSVSNIEYRDHAWMVSTRLENHYHANYIIGADGRKSIVAKKLKLQKKISSKKVALHYLATPSKPFKRSGEMHLFQDGSYIGINPINDREVNVSLVCHPKLIKEYKTVKNLMNGFILQSPSLTARLGEISDQTELHTVSPLRNLIKKVAKKNYALIGDAAGFLDPLTGEGMTNAVATATFLSEEINKNPSNITRAFKYYQKRKLRHFFQKTVLNTLFQWVIRYPKIVERIAIFIGKTEKRRNSFIGIIGNIYSPLEGFKKILF